MRCASVLALFSLACSSPSETGGEPAVDASAEVAVDTGTGGAPAADATDGTSEDAKPYDSAPPDAPPVDAEAGPACNTEACAVADDCVAALQGVAGCWSCTAGCCEGVTAGTDPSNACASAGTVCRPAACDGQGQCTWNNAAFGTPCGKVCSALTYIADAECNGNGDCVAVQGSSASCGYSPTGFCTGAENFCDKCPPSGCSASCAGSGGQSCP